MRISNYTIMSQEALLLERDCTCQFTLNGRIFPSKRKTHEFLEANRSKINANFIIHYDFLWIASRFAFLSAEVQQEVVTEISNIFNTCYKYPELRDKLKGIVMHTDYPLRKDIHVISGGELTGMHSQVLDEYRQKKVYDSLKIAVALEDNTVANHILSGYTRLARMIDDNLESSDNDFRILLENTTKVQKHNDIHCIGTSQSITDYLQTCEVKHRFGICYDTEHSYAAGEPQKEPFVVGCPTVIHLNPIPKGVEKGSFKDKHSETTLFECSKRNLLFYKGYLDMLSTRGMTYIRECWDETRIREQEQLKEFTQ